MPDDQVKKIEMNNKDKVPTNTHLLKPIIKIDLKAWLIQLLVWIFIVCLVFFSFIRPKPFYSFFSSPSHQALRPLKRRFSALSPVQTRSNSYS